MWCVGGLCLVGNHVVLVTLCYQLSLPFKNVDVGARDLAYHLLEHAYSVKTHVFSDSPLSH